MSFILKHQQNLDGILPSIQVGESELYLSNKGQVPVGWPMTDARADGVEQVSTSVFWSLSRHRYNLIGWFSEETYPYPYSWKQFAKMLNWQVRQKPICALQSLLLPGETGMFRCGMLVRILSFTSGFVIRRIICWVSHLSQLRNRKIPTLTEMIQTKITLWIPSNLDKMIWQRQASTSTWLEFHGLLWWMWYLLPASWSLKNDWRRLFDQKEVSLIYRWVEKNTSVESVENYC